ncbi:MAG: hypothetical protein ACTHU0_15825 [Kofleriaceae bacterium]
MTGDAFEAEVIVALHQSFTGGCQRIPDKPNGDGGIDGLSHNGRRAYCCYGLEMLPSPGTLPARLRQKIAKKFKSDLLRIHELDFNNKKLVHKTNTALAGILGNPPIQLIENITLVANIFEDNQLIGDLKSAQAEYLKVSRNRFVHPNCELILWGPEDVANHASVTEQFLLRVEHPALFAAIQSAAKQAPKHVLPNQHGFNQKFNDLAQRVSPARKSSIEALRDEFRKGWSRSILLNDQLASTLPDLHEEFERVRRRAATDANIQSNKPGVDPFTLVEKAREGLREQMAGLVNGGLPSGTRDELVDAETGRLLGECPLEWRA